MFGQLSGSISNGHLDLTVLAGAGSQIFPSGETVSFLGKKIIYIYIFFYLSSHSEHGVFSLRAWPASSLGSWAGVQRLAGSPAFRLLGQRQLCVLHWCGFAQLSCGTDTILSPLTKQLSSPAVGVSLSEGLRGIRAAKHNLIPSLNVLWQKKFLNHSLSTSAILVIQVTSKCFSWTETWDGNI